MQRFAALFAIESRIRGQPPDRRLAVRQQYARPRLDRKGRSFSYIAGEIDVCRDVLRRELRSRRIAFRSGAQAAYAAEVEGRPSHKPHDPDQPALRRPSNMCSKFSGRKFGGRCRVY